jgi:hypothetical protein
VLLMGWLQAIFKRLIWQRDPEVLLMRRLQSLPNVEGATKHLRTTGKVRKSLQALKYKDLTPGFIPPGLALLANEAVARATAEEKADKRIAQRHAPGAMASGGPSSSAMEHAQKSVSGTADQSEGHISNSHDPNKDAPRSAANSSNTAVNPVPPETSEKERSDNPNNSRLAPEDYSSIFRPTQFNICIQPHIAGLEQYIDGGGMLRHKEASFVHNQKRRPIAVPVTDFQGAAVFQQVGEKFFEVNETGVKTGGLYNFAKLPGGLEDMAEVL